MLGSEKMIKVIFWDVDNTLLSFDAQEKNALEHCFKEFNLGELTKDKLETYNRINIRYWERLERKEITRNEVLINRFKEFFDLYEIQVD